MLMTTTDVHNLLGRGTTVQVTDIATGKRIVRQWYQRYGHVWISVADQVASWHECSPEDVHAIDTDGGEMITVNGVVVATLEHVR